PRTVSRRRQREERLRPQERVAAILRDREQLDACETLLLRARADVDAGRDREAALQLRIGVEALLAELEAVAGPDQKADLASLRDDQKAPVEKRLETAERVLRRRRVLRG
ncbi:MAG TPA: hypothetical protein VKH20_08835, partial [Solirubrobacterales bacterium]|nr:hypothetical protein [Solirubrobacterales bacterium]